MRTKLGVAAISLALLGLLAGGTTLASATTRTQARTAWGMPGSSASAPATAPAEVQSAGSDITTAKTIVVVSPNETQTETEIDNPPEGFSQGDQIVVTSPLFNRAGAQVGRLDVHGVITQAEPSIAIQWVFTASLSKGQLTAQGVQTEEFSFKAAVTGGTGAFRNARGQMVVRFLEDAARLTYQLIR